MNETFAVAHFAGANPVGHRLWFGDGTSGTPIEIVSMTRDAKYTDLRSPTRSSAEVVSGASVAPHMLRARSRCPTPAACHG